MPSSPLPPEDRAPAPRPARRPTDAGLWSDQQELSAGDYWALLAHRTVWLLLSTALLAEGSRRWPSAWWPLLGLPTAVTVWWLGSGLRMRVPVDSRRIVRRYATGLLVGGSAGVVAWFRFTHWPWLLLTGVVAIVIGGDAWLTSLRWQHRQSARLPVALACACVVLTVVAASSRSATSTVWPIAVLAAAGVCGYFTFAFGAEPWLRRTGRRWLPAPWDLVAGAALVVAAGAWFGALSGWLAVLVVLAIAALAAITVSDIDAELVLALLLIVALFWATFPRDADPQRFLDRIDTADRVVIALGDSYLSGEGAGRYELGTNVVGQNVCRRSATAWPLTFAPESTLSISLACSGAVIADVSGKAQYQAEPPRWDQFPDGADQLTRLSALLERAKPAAVSQVVVGIGGNDLGFSQIGITCIGAGDCDRPEVSDIWRSRLPKLRTDLAQLYRTIRTTMDDHGASQAELLVAGYPVSMTPDGCWWTLLSAREHAFLVALISELDATVAAAASDAGATYVPAVASALENAHRRLCEVPLWRAGINLLSLNPMQGSLLASLDPRHWVNNSFHPNQRGHAAIRTAVDAWLTDRWSVDQVEVPNVVAPCASAEACDAQVARWSRRQLLAGATNIAVPVALAFAGWALCWTSVQRALRARRLSLTVALARRLLPGARAAMHRAGVHPTHLEDLR